MPISRIAAAALCIAYGGACAQDPPKPTGSPVTEATAWGNVPDDVPRPSPNLRMLEGTWHQITRPAAGPHVGSEARRRAAAGVLANDENAPWSFEQCAPQPVFMGGMGIAIIATADVIVIANEEFRNYRVIFMNARQPAALVASRNGYSVGHWDHETLVVETTGLTRQGGAPTRARITERIRRTHGGLWLEDRLTVADPDIALPYTNTSRYSWRPDLQVSEEICEEGYGQYVLRGGELDTRGEGH
jgi:hypothetical protein